MSGGDYEIDTITIKDPTFILETRNNILNLDAIIKTKDNITNYRPNQYKYFKVNKLVILDGKLNNYRTQYKENSEVITSTMVVEPFITKNKINI